MIVWAEAHTQSGKSYCTSVPVSLLVLGSSGGMTVALAMWSSGSRLRRRTPEVAEHLVLKQLGEMVNGSQRTGAATSGSEEF